MTLISESRNLILKIFKYPEEKCTPATDAHDNSVADSKDLFRYINIRTLPPWHCCTVYCVVRVGKDSLFFSALSGEIGTRGFSLEVKVVQEPGWEDFRLFSGRVLLREKTLDVETLPVKVEA